jgi:hypothetical protein
VNGHDPYFADVVASGALTDADQVNVRLALSKLAQIQALLDSDEWARDAATVDAIARASDALANAVADIRSGHRRG